MATINFNPRTREGCDKMQSKLIKDMAIISIHAPVKGATLACRVDMTQATISIHAPVKGATAPLLFPIQYQLISIHAPVKGATSMKRIKGKIKYLFQSTHP